MNELPPSYHPRHPTLYVEGIGHVPTFKNNKSIAINRRTRKPFVMTDPKKKAWMDQCIQNFERQLRFILATRGGVTPTDHYRPSLIASLAPLDDSRQWIPELNVRCVEVEGGREGAEIVLEQI